MINLSELAAMRSALEKDPHAVQPAPAPMIQPGPPSGAMAGRVLARSDYDRMPEIARNAYTAAGGGVGS